MDSDTIAGITALAVGYMAQRGWVKHSASASGAAPAALDPEAVKREAVERLLARLLECYAAAM